MEIILLSREWICINAKWSYYDTTSANKGHNKHKDEGKKKKASEGSSLVGEENSTPATSGLT
jgi:hypothetical protein